MTLVKMNKFSLIIKIRIFSIVFTILLIIIGCKTGKPIQVTKKAMPNIVFIMADDLGYNHLGAYGQDKIKTPHIDKLATQGVRFTQFYAGANVCGPSRTSIMLGLHTGHVPYRENRNNHLAAEYAPYGKLKTLGQVMKQAGYETGYFGKYGIGGDENIENGLKPNDIGFDEFWGLLEHGHGHFHFPAYIWHNKSKVPLNNNTRPSNRPYGLSSRNTDERKEHIDDVFSEKAIEFVKEKAVSGSPFFCYLSFSIPHTEMLPNEKFAKQYRELGWEEYNSIDNGSHVPTNTPRANFAGMVSQIDDWTGRLLKALEESGVEDNTIVIFTSDNGGQLRETWGDAPSVFFKANGVLRKGKEWNYEGGIRVPLIVKWPSKISPNSTNDHIGYFPDLMPTFAEIANVSEAVPDKIDGISFMPTLIGKKQNQHEYLYWERPNYVKKGNTYEIDKSLWRQATRFGKWKALREHTTDSIELYNLEEDLSEKNNVADVYPDIVDKARKIFKIAHFEPKSLPQN